jgi:predicted nucleotidyltransferase
MQTDWMHEPEELNLQYFLSNGVLTGSRAFGVAKPDSDWDIIIELDTLPRDWMYYVCDYHVCIDFTGNFKEEPSSDEADGIDDAEYVPKKDAEYIWGKELLVIIKIWNNEENEEECINLFIYDNGTKDLFSKFKQVNTIMNFTLTKEQLSDRDTRVDRFIECLDKFGISHKPKPKVKSIFDFQLNTPPLIISISI